MIVSAALLPHCPALIPEIGKESQKEIPQTKALYKKMIEEFQEQSIETVIIVSGQTAPSMNEFWIHDEKDLIGDFSLFEYDSQIHVKNNTDLRKNIVAQAKNYNIRIGKTDSMIDFGHAIPLYFLKKAFPEISCLAVHICFESVKNHKNFGELISLETLTRDEKIGIIISTDLSNKVDKKKSQNYDTEAHIWNQQFMKLAGGHLSQIHTLDPFITEDVGGSYPVRSIAILEGLLSKYLYKQKSSCYEEAFGVGYGSILFEIG